LAGQTRFNADTIANEIEVANKCSGDNVYTVGNVEVGLENFLF